MSQLLPDTLSDLISDIRSALLRDSLWWEADKEEGSNSDQKHCYFNSCFTLFPHVFNTPATTVLDWQLDNCICFYSHHYVPIILNSYNNCQTRPQPYRKSDWGNYLARPYLISNWQLDSCICFYSHHYISYRTHAISYVTLRLDNDSI